MDFFKKYWLVIVIFILLALIGAKVYKDSRKPSASNDGSGSPFAPSVGSGGSMGGIDENRILSKGSTGSEVSELQRLINEAYRKLGLSTRITVDGVFGTQTENALLSALGKSTITVKEAKTLLGM